MPDPTWLGGLLLQAALLAAVLEGARRRNVAITVNAAGALAATLLPAAIEAAIGSPGAAFPAVVTVWIAAAGVLHSLGMLGFYESTWWWDHLTHTVSGALIAALVYAGIAIGTASGHLDDLPGGVAGATVAFVAVVAVCWELLELVARAVGERYDIEPVLVHYGWRDTALDLAFTLAGATLVVALDLRLHLPIAEAHPAATSSVVTWSAGAVAVGSVALALALHAIQ